LLLHLFIANSFIASWTSITNCFNYNFLFIQTAFTQIAITLTSYAMEEDAAVRMPTQIQFLSISQPNVDELRMNLKGTTNKHLNTLRHLLIGLVPTMSLSDDASHIQFHSLPRGQMAEVLINRLQMLPFTVNAELLSALGVQSSAVLSEDNSLQFELYAEYPRPVDSQTGKVKEFLHPGKIQEEPVYSSFIRWLPANEAQYQKLVQHHTDPGNYWFFHSPFLSKALAQQEEEEYAEEMLYQQKYSKLRGRESTAQKQHQRQVIGPAFSDYNVTLLKPGDTLHVTFTLTKGNNPVAKKRNWSPVSVVMAQPRPAVTLLNPIVDMEDAASLVATCPRQVFALVAPSSMSLMSSSSSSSLCTSLKAEQQQASDAAMDTSGFEMKEMKETVVANNGVSLVRVEQADNCSMCKACINIRSEAISKSVLLGDSPDEFFFTIETRGGVPVHMLLISACTLASEFCAGFLEELHNSAH
jgi:hypothetical protein